VRVLLDTNVLVSAYATRGLCADVLRVVLSEHELVVAEVVLIELQRVLVTKLGLPEELVDEILTALREHPVQPRPAAVPERPQVPDPDDAWVLASALEAEVEVLITGDPDLLDIADKPKGLRILNPRGFWTLLRGA
jgi:putative PIN family toxin of toxin-antitoxin system